LDRGYLTKPELQYDKELLLILSISIKTIVQTYQDFFTVWAGTRDLFLRPINFLQGRRDRFLALPIFYRVKGAGSSYHRKLNTGPTLEFSGSLSHPTHYSPNPNINQYKKGASPTFGDALFHLVLSITIVKERFCPRTSKLRTWRWRNGESVSEDEQASDTVVTKWQVRVRRRVNFRQSSNEMASLCPKASKLRTGMQRKSDGVSEDELTSDKEGAKSRRCV